MPVTPNVPPTVVFPVMPSVPPTVVFPEELIVDADIAVSTGNPVVEIAFVKNKT